MTGTDDTRTSVPGPIAVQAAGNAAVQAVGNAVLFCLLTETRERVDAVTLATGSFELSYGVARSCREPTEPIDFDLLNGHVGKITLDATGQSKSYQATEHVYADTEDIILFELLGSGGPAAILDDALRCVTDAARTVA